MGPPGPGAGLGLVGMHQNPHASSSSLLGATVSDVVAQDSLSPRSDDHARAFGDLNHSHKHRYVLKGINHVVAVPSSGGGVRWALAYIKMDVLRANLEWLNHHPGGFKLNVPLTRRLGAVALTVLDINALMLEWGIPRLMRHPAMVHLVGTLALTLGWSTVLAALFDLARLATAHLSLLYVTFARLYYLDLSLLSCLWRLFRGKKHNILRQRVDTCEYRTPQLVLGVLLFAIFSCLFPTVAAFYIFFTIAQVGPHPHHTMITMGASVSTTCTPLPPGHDPWRPHGPLASVRPGTGCSPLCLHPSPA